MNRTRRRCSHTRVRAVAEDWTWTEIPAKQEAARGLLEAKRRELRLCGAPRAGPRKWLWLDAAEHDPAAAEVQLGAIADDDQLERDDALAGRGRLDEQPPVELKRERALPAPAHRVHLGDDLG